ncbi:hypothetical protein IFO70_23600 [Phormidium tenue FACHB-886]|nr:hypothetical protein [Phormidium tenue FACHB-886]
MKTNESAKTSIQSTNNSLWSTLSDAESQAIKAGEFCHGVTVLAWARVDGASPLR